MPCRLWEPLALVLMILSTTLISLRSSTTLVRGFVGTSSTGTWRIYSNGASQSLYHGNFLGRSSSCHYVTSREVRTEEQKGLRCDESDDQSLANHDDDDENDNQSLSLSDHIPDNLVPGANEGFYIVKTYKTDPNGFDLNALQNLEEKDVERLDITPQNISVPLALMVLDPIEYPSRSRARKACRKANIMIHRGPLETDELGKEEVFDSAKCQRARVGDRIFPGDVLAKQIRIGDGLFPVLGHKRPPFDLPVIYEDDHFAIVNKPAGVVVYAQRKGGHGLMTVRAALPFAVQPPTPGTFSTLRRPQPVHRLDKPTSGLLIVAKTKPAMVHLSHQFRDRKVKKTYVALVNGIPQEPRDTAVTAAEARELGVDVGDDDDTNGEKSTSWQLIDHPLEEKHAVTVWRALKYGKSLKANDNYVTLVELKPKTGRYHQLRRHLSWVCGTPIIGDSEYDGGGQAMQLRERGLFLCSNRVTLEHPFYNDLEEDAAVVYDRLSEQERDFLWLSPSNRIMVTASIDVPEKFAAFMQHEEERFQRLALE